MNEKPADVDNVDTAEDIDIGRAYITFGDLQAALAKHYRGADVPPFRMEDVFEPDARPAPDELPPPLDDDEDDDPMPTDADDEPADDDDDAHHRREAERDGFSSGWIQLIRCTEIQRISRQVRTHRRVTRRMGQQRPASDMRLLPGRR